MRAITRNLGASGKSSADMPLSAGDQGVNRPQKRVKLLARQGEVALGIDHLEPGVRQDLTKTAWLCSQKIRADQNSWHGHLGRK